MNRERMKKKDVKQRTTFSLFLFSRILLVWRHNWSIVEQPPSFFISTFRFFRRSFFIKIFKLFSFSFEFFFKLKCYRRKEFSKLHGKNSATSIDLWVREPESVRHSFIHSTVQSWLIGFKARGRVLKTVFYEIFSP